MLITTTIEKTETITREINLPYYTKSAGTYYRVNEDQSILTVYASMEYGKYASVSLADRSIGMVWNNAVNGIETTKEEFEATLKIAIEHMDTVLYALTTT